MASARLRGPLAARQFYALIWKDFVVHKRHYIWTLLEVTIPVLVCAMAILSNSHQGKPKLENERTFDPDDYERIYGDLNPQRHTLLVAPNSTFTRALVDQIDDGAVKVELCNSERDLVELIKREIPVSLDQVKRLLPDDSSNVTIGGVVIRSDENLMAGGARATAAAPAAAAEEKENYYYEVISKLDGQRMKIPVNFDMSIRAKDFRLGPEPFPKKYSLGPFVHSDHYAATFFMASQLMLSRAYINLLANYMSNNSSGGLVANSTLKADIVIPTNDDIIGQRMPYPKYVTHKRLKETTLGTFVAGSQKQKPFVLTMDYCITVGFLVTAIFLAKRIVDERKSRIRDMMRLVGISDWTYYGSHMCNTMLIMIIQCAMIALLFTGHLDAPAQNIDSSLLFVILIIYCVASIMFVLALSTLFNSSTKAIIFTSLLWLGLPEVIDRIFKLNSGVIESNGFLVVHERVHLLFSLMPNFALRLMNRLLTECDIYGEFYAKKNLYAEYRAIWPNINNLLPLYKFITVGQIMLAMLASIPMYACLIYLINTLASKSGGAASLASLTSDSGDDKNSHNALATTIKWLIRFTITLIVTPFKLVYYLAFGRSSQHHETAKAQAGHWNSAYAPSVSDLSAGQQQQRANNSKVHMIDLSRFDRTEVASEEEDDGSQQDPKYFEQAPRMLSIGVSIRNLCKTYYTPNSQVRRLDAVKNVSLDMFYSQILGKYMTLTKWSRVPVRRPTNKFHLCSAAWPQWSWKNNADRHNQRPQPKEQRPNPHRRPQHRHAPGRGAAQSRLLSPV